MGINLLTSKEVAVLLNVPESWVKTQARLGKIPKVQNLGKYVRFSQDVIYKFFLSNEGRSFSSEYIQRKRKQSAL